MKAITRIKQYIDFKGLTNSKFEKGIGLSNGYIRNQLKKNADLGESILIKILEKELEINPEWLLTGKGEMLKEKSLEVQEDKEVDKKNENTELSSISDKLDFISNNLRIIKMLNDIRFTIIADKLDIELDVDISENMFKDEFKESKSN